MWTWNLLCPTSPIPRSRSQFPCKDRQNQRSVGFSTSDFRKTSPFFFPVHKYPLQTKEITATDNYIFIVCSHSHASLSAKPGRENRIWTQLLRQSITDTHPLKIKAMTKDPLWLKNQAVRDLCSPDLGEYWRIFFCLGGIATELLCVCVC